MKYSEFKEWLSDNDWDFSDDDCWITVTSVLSVSKQNNNSITTGINCHFNTKHTLTLLKKAIELAETPLEDREDEKEYYLKHMFINVKGDSNYLNMDTTNGGLFLMDVQLDPWSMYKTKFTERELDKIEDTGFDLRNFESVEVEE